MPVKSSIIALAVLAAATAARAQTVLSIYSAGPAPLINQLASGFSKQTGVKTVVFQATTGQIMARLQSEASNPRSDVLISASWDVASDFAKRGWTLPYEPPEKAAAQMPNFLRRDGAAAEGVSGLGIAWSKASGAPRPTEWSDLTRPAYKDKVVVPDPAQSGASFELTAALEAKSGGWGLFRALKANGAVIADANAQAMNAVLQGGKAAVFGAVDYIAYAEKKKGEDVDMIFPTSGTVVAPRPMILLKWTKQPKQAKAFLDYVLSDAGQAIVAKAELMPARLDVPADRPGLKDIKLMSLDETKALEQRKALLSGFDSVFGR